MEKFNSLNRVLVNSIQRQKEDDPDKSPDNPIGQLFIDKIKSISHKK